MRWPLRRACSPWGGKALADDAVCLRLWKSPLDLDVEPPLLLFPAAMHVRIIQERRYQIVDGLRGDVDLPPPVLWPSASWQPRVYWSLCSSPGIARDPSGVLMVLWFL